MEKMEEEEKEQPCQARKPFRKPHLRVYGNISAITQAAMGMGELSMCRDGRHEDGRLTTSL